MVVAERERGVGWVEERKKRGGLMLFGLVEKWVN